MNVSVLLGIAHPYHENSYSWVVNVYNDEKVAQDKCDKLNKINDDNYKKWCSYNDDNYKNWKPNSDDFETVEPFAWYSKDVLQQMRDIVPNAIPPFDKDNFKEHDYSINYKVETLHMIVTQTNDYR